jgi:hypothetical protein
VSIKRAERRTQFYVLPMSVIGDDRLSWEARGMLVYLLSKPDHWQVQMTDLLSCTASAIGKAAKRDKVYLIINELRLAGYVYRWFNRAGGEFVGVEYEVSETPDLEAAAEYERDLRAKGKYPFTEKTEAVKSPVKPLTDLPETVPPVTAKPETLDKTERSFKTEKAVRKPSVSPQAAEGPGDLPEDLTVPAGYPAEYPSNPTSATYAAWRAYAIAFKARYKVWPVHNVTVAGLMGKVVARIQAAAPAAATYFVEKEDAPSLVDARHPVGALLKSCEGYAVKAQQVAEAKKRANKVAEVVKAAEALNSAPPPGRQGATPAPKRTPASIAASRALKQQTQAPQGRPIASPIPQSPEINPHAAFREKPQQNRGAMVP